MSIITETVQPTALPGPDCYTLYRMTVEKYEAMVASGVFTKRDRFQLINGLLVAKMTKNPLHSIAKGNCADALRRVIPTPGWHVREEDPVRLPPFNEPEPDICVARGKRADHDPHPGSADIGLLVEVSDTTLADDRKMALTYAATGVPVYWIVNLVDRQVEVYTSPAADGYGVRLNYLPWQEVPVILDGTVVDHIRVSDILP
jgi:Uma2 family endonuclease